MTAIAYSAVTAHRDRFQGQVHSELSHGFHLHWPWRRAVRGLRALRPLAEARLTVAIAILYGVGAVAIGAYMLAAMLRPEKF
jgi:hypothetical protein